MRVCRGGSWCSRCTWSRECWGSGMIEARARQRSLPRSWFLPSRSSFSAACAASYPVTSQARTPLGNRTRWTGPASRIRAYRG